MDDDLMRYVEQKRAAQGPLRAKITQRRTDLKAERQILDLLEELERLQGLQDQHLEMFTEINTLRLENEEIKKERDALKYMLEQAIPTKEEILGWALARTIEKLFPEPDYFEDYFEE